MKTAIASVKLNITPRALWALTFFAIMSLLIFSIIQVNAYTKEMYLIKGFESKLAQLTQESKGLEINFSQVNSLNNIGTYAKNQVFERAGQVDYIKVLDSTVLAK